ncbi:hypothetical protein RF11_09663 [Thelohanellus kitauei]|uniref:Integrin beta n=1 Tax=Thelohanellus kitauei TaxID=669202 RepID=A0A0C2MF91_THEKT|nr:hypothetical protein RF11_09663 [Thelohanellus kitauei]
MEGFSKVIYPETRPKFLNSMIEALAIMTRLEDDGGYRHEILFENDDYIDSLDTQKGMRHCVLIESSTNFKPDDIYNSPQSVKAEISIAQSQTFKDSINIHDLVINPQQINVYARAGKYIFISGNETIFDITAIPIHAKNLNIYFLVHRTSALFDIFNTISNNLDIIFREMTIPSRFPGTKMGIGEFVDIAYFPFEGSPPTKDEAECQHLKVRPTLGLGGPKSVLDAIAQFESSADDDKLIRLMIVVTESSSKRSGHGDDYIHPHLLGQSLLKNNIRVLILTNSTKIKHYEVLTESFKHQVIDILDYATLNSAKLMVIIKKAVQVLEDLNVASKNPFSVSESGSLECRKVGTYREAKLNIKMRPSISSYPADSYVTVNEYIKVGVNVQISWECNCATNVPKPDVPKNRTADDVNKVECNNDQECGEYGKCICGKCLCQMNGFTVKVVHALMRSARLPKKGNVLVYLIFGNNQGTCECGTCRCNPGFKGTVCSEMECYNPIVMNRCKQTEGDDDCSGRGTCLCGTCICPYEFSGTLCETFTKCMVKVFDSKELTRCNISVTKVEKLEESACILLFIQAFFVQTCQMIHRNCSHSFQIYINKNGTHINRITLQMLDPMEGLMNNVTDCVRDSNSFFRKRLLQNKRREYEESSAPVADH